jgi:hypothetical protein
VGKAVYQFKIYKAAVKTICMLHSRLFLISKNAQNATIVIIYNIASLEKLQSFYNWKPKKQYKGKKQQWKLHVSRDDKYIGITTV